MSKKLCTLAKSIIFVKIQTQLAFGLDLLKRRSYKEKPLKQIFNGFSYVLKILFSKRTYLLR